MHMRQREFVIAGGASLDENSPRLLRRRTPRNDNHMARDLWNRPLEEKEVSMSKISNRIVPIAIALASLRELWSSAEK